MILKNLYCNLSFPYTYTNKIELLNNKIREKHLDINYITNLIYKKIKITKPVQIQVNENQLEYTDLATLFNYEYSVSLKVLNEGNDINIIYEINFSKLLNITLVGLILLAFFSFVSVKIFLILAGIFSLIFYIANLLFINNIVKKSIEHAIGSNIYTFNEKEELTEEQMEWMADKYRCSACGYLINEYDLECPDCGLNFKKDRRKIPVDISKHKDKKINYHFKKREDI